MFKVATWNVNSLRVRLPQVLTWLASAQPDILGLQETKVVDADFPVDDIRAAGYHALFRGEKTYNGVAILSKLEAKHPVRQLPGMEDTQCRFLAASFSDVQFINVYVPNGQEVGSDKYKYKLAWLQSLKKYVHGPLQRHARLLIVGDFNIAPDDRDVHDAKQWQDQILCSGPERKAFSDLLAEGLKDSFRLFTQAENSFSWWDYRAMAFRRNRGLRIDHILMSDSLSAACTKSYIDKTPRKLERPSDHTPVIAELDIEL